MKTSSTSTRRCVPGMELFHFVAEGLTVGNRGARLQKETWRGRVEASDESHARAQIECFIEIDAWSHQEVFVGRPAVYLSIGATAKIMFS